MNALPEMTAPDVAYGAIARAESRRVMPTIRVEVPEYDSLKAIFDALYFYDHGGKDNEETVSVIRAAYERLVDLYEGRE